jgi:hypothetical protein
MTEPAGTAQAVADAAEHLILIARDIRSWGDVPLVELSDEGVTRSPLTLAGELELIALQLDFDGVTKRVAAERENGHA